LNYLLLFFFFFSFSPHFNDPFYIRLHQWFDTKKWQKHYKKQAVSKLITYTDRAIFFFFFYIVLVCATT
jgi:hypothetical protein